MNSKTLNLMVSVVVEYHAYLLTYELYSVSLRSDSAYLLTYLLMKCAVFYSILTAPALRPFNHESDVLTTELSSLSLIV